MEQDIIFIDSWIWIELYSQSKKWERCKQILLSKDKKYISSIVLTEVKYRLSITIGEEKTNKIMGLIVSDESIVVVPITQEIALYAAELRMKYYKKPKSTLSYADCINLATAIMTGCKELFTGDPDFERIEEIKTTIV